MSTTVIRHVFRSCICLIFFSWVIPNVFSQESSRHVIKLKNGDLVCNGNASHWLDSFSKKHVGESEQLLLHFDSPLSPKHKELLANNGITLLEYIPENTYVAIIRFPLNINTLATVPFHSIFPSKAETKTDAIILSKIVNEKRNLEVLVSFYASQEYGLDNIKIKQYISDLGGKIESSSMEQYGMYKINISPSNLLKLANWYGVRSINPITKIVPCDLQSRPAVMGNISLSAPYNLSGEGVTVGVGDNASGIYHADINDRITNFNPAPMSHHGEHVNGIVGGAANIDPLAGSMAPHVSLLDFLYDLVLPESGVMFQNYNMTITNNSYAVILGNCSYAGTYDGYAQLIDTLALKYPYVLHVFASGNDGNNSCAPYPAGFATCAGGYQPAKNNVVVGSVMDYLVEAGDQSRGPVKDGRIKPEVVAVGLGAYSTIDTDNYEWAAGTSMASPQVAGGLAVLTERFKQLNSNALPNNDLLKAILLNGAQDLGAPGPDYRYGFGCMDIYRSLRIIDSQWYLRNSVAFGDSQIINITVPANTAQVKVMLCWNDVPASIGSATQLVNDLDLTVQDPSHYIHYPLVPDSTPANVLNVATEKPDHINNVEQVTISNPSAGNYNIKVKGYNIPSSTSSQTYSLTYIFIPKGVRLTFPIGGEQFTNGVDIWGDTIRVFWDAIDDIATFTAKFSPDLGATWRMLDANVKPGIRHTDFRPDSINSGKCIIRVINNSTGDSSTSGRFAFNLKPVIVLDSAQCPGYVNIHWSPTPNATAYLMMKKKGAYMQVVDSVTDTFYSFSNMPLDRKSYVAVMPVIANMHGYRSVAARVLANGGTCNNPVSFGDIMLEGILSPSNGRQNTTNRLGNNEKLKLKIRNLFNSNCSNYSISYQVNGGSWHSQTMTNTIPANGVIVDSISGLDLSLSGSYDIMAAIHNMQQTDKNTANDTFEIKVLNIQNSSINLSTPFSDGFEGWSIFSCSHDSVGVDDGHWDYFNINDSGRIRSFVADDIIISGLRSVSLDENQFVKNGSKNRFVGTFNLSNYDTASTEIRFDFDYVLHGIPSLSDGNVVSARGNDTSFWSDIFSYDQMSYPGNIIHAQSISLTDALRNTQTNFSTSTEISFGQNDSSLIAAANYGNGITIDNFRMYLVTNDAQLAGIITPLPSNCGLPNSTPLTVQVHNGVGNTIHNISLFYQMDGGIIYTGSIDSIAGKKTINFTFSQLLALSSAADHILNVWLKVAGDSYPYNDSILEYNFHNSATISTFPYLENFESGNGGYFSGGYKDSWQFGTPASPKIHKAASGTKAWKTNLTGNYNNLEKSYLYSPCFDLSSLNSPMLSFSMAEDVENCGGTLCDQSYVEYTFDGITWTRLGETGQGTNWYDPTFNVWNTNNFTRWHVASIPLPRPPAGETMHFRFVMAADPGANFEGLAIDDIHIFDRISSILSSTTEVIVNQNISGNQWNDFEYATLLQSSLNPDNQNMGNTIVTSYPHDTITNPDATQCIFSHNYSIKCDNQPQNNVGIRLFLTEGDFVAALTDTFCPSCSKPIDAYSLGITQYSNSANLLTENGSLTDDTGGFFSYHPYSNVTWVPHDNGYYAEFESTPVSEFWFNDGGPTGNFPLGTNYLDFVAFKTGNDVRLSWLSLIDSNVVSYKVQKSNDGINFTTIKDTLSHHASTGKTYSLTDNSPNFSTPLYYRLVWKMNNKNGLFYSPIRIIDSSDSLFANITFNAVQIDHNHVRLRWESSIDGFVKYYSLERAVNNSEFTGIVTLNAFKHNIQQYEAIDQPNISIDNNTLVNYRLSAVLEDGTKITLPIKTITWVNANTLVSIYPNPTKEGNISIDWYADAGTLMRLALTDLTGKQLRENSVTASQWKNTTVLPPLQLPKGIYFVNLLIGDRRYNVKVVWE